MYATCLFCNSALGRNEAVEHFPVGRGLAYDAAEGRLWVVCRRCARWNLTPLEERWEAIEEAERLFRAARLRIATDNIGLARLPEGLELVRIGAPPRLELASWRYADRLVRRRRRALALGALASGTGAASFVLLIGGPAALAFGGAAILCNAALFSRELLLSGRVVPDGSGGHITLDWPDLRTAALERVPEVGDWALRVRRGGPLPGLRDMREAMEELDVEFDAVLQERLRVAHAVRRDAMEAPRLVADGGDGGGVILRGEDARRALTTILPLLNGGGGSSRDVRDAVDVVAGSASVHQLLYGVAGRRTRARTPNYLRRLTPAMRLALEMAVHEDEERRAMAGALDALEQRWREAEEVARIADALAVPARVLAGLHQLRQRLRQGERS